MTSETRGTRAPWMAGTAVRGLAVCGLAVAAALAAGAAHAQSNNVVVDMSVLNEVGQPRNVPQLLQPSGRSLLMPNAAGNASGRLQQLVPPSAGRSAAPRQPARPSLNRPARPDPPAMAERPAPREAPPTPPRATAEAPQQLTRNTPPEAPPPPPEIPSLPKDSAEAPSAPAAPQTASPSSPQTAAPQAAAPPPPPPPPPAAPPAPEPPPAAATARPPTPAAPADDKAGQQRPGETQTASAPPSGGGGLAPGKQFRLNFDAGEATLGSSAERTLDDVSTALEQDNALRLQLLAYAGSSSETDSQARRLSLSRALTVRSYLIAKGMRSTRIDVRALGNKSEGGPPDRVDIIVTSR